jgi:flagellar motor switch protein FliM
VSPPSGPKEPRPGDPAPPPPIPKRSQFGLNVERISGKQQAMGGGGGGRRSEKAWKPFRWSSLEKVTRLQGQLVRRLEWMLPNVTTSGEVSQSVKKRLHELLEEEVQLTADYVHVVPTRNLRRYMGDPTFLAVLAPQPNKTRGFLEIELGLAHAAIDMLLGGAGEAISLRPLTDIEEGVMTYVILETLKALAPSVDPSLPKLRLEGVCRNFEEAVQLLGDEQHLAVVQLKATFGAHTGYLRLFVPQAVLSLANPPADAAVRKARRAADAAAHLRRLSAVKTWLRAEIGTVQISASELQQIRERDVVLVDNLTAQPHKGEGGTAKLKVGAGHHGWLDAEVVVKENRYLAKITGVVTGEGDGPIEALDEQEPAGDGGEEKPEPGADESTNPGTDPRGSGREAREARVDETLKGSEGAELLNDIPLQVAVELARVPISAEEVVALKIGQVIDLNRVAGEPIDLSVNGKIVARGELVEVDGNLGVRVLSLAG